jgi:putative phosphoribosyl transferase
MRSEVVKFSLNNSSADSFIEGTLSIPDNPKGVIVFVHGSGSSKSSHRNQLVSEKLNDTNIATFLFDLLSREEQKSDTQLENIKSKIPGAVLNKFNIPLLTARVSMATEWIMNNMLTRRLQIGYFASSSGGAAALIAASKYNIRSIVIRSGRTDLVENQFLSQIVSPCLFIAGSKEKTLVKINKETIKKLRNSKDKKLVIIEDASHLLENEGTIHKVAQVASEWIILNFT